MAQQWKRRREPLYESFAVAALVVDLPLRTVLVAVQAQEEARAHEEAQSMAADHRHLEVARAVVRSLRMQEVLVAALAAAHAQQLH